MNYLLNVNRAQALAVATALLLLYAVISHIWAGWGLITVHAKAEPLSKVLATMQRQGHAKIQTDLPLDTPVTMDVNKVQLTDALETLSVVTEARWRLLYFIAGDKATLNTGETAWFGGQHPDGWKMLSFQMGGGMFNFGDPDAAPLDPRGDTWSPKTAAPAPVQTFLTEASQATNASFAFPVAWNPTVTRVPSSGTVTKVVPKLVSAAGGHEEQMFFLAKNERRGPRQDRGGGPVTGDFHPDFDLLAQRAQNEINRLPDDQRADAQAFFNSQEAFRKSLAGMTDDQRRQAFMQHMQDPQLQDQMAAQQDARDARSTHNQRMQRMQNYVNRKLTAMGKL